MSSEPRKAFVCPQCREAHGDPLYVGPGGLCYGCWLDTYIPFGHEGREKYEYDSVWGHLNATCRPPLGVEFLDAKGSKVCEILRATRQRPRF